MLIGWFFANGDLVQELLWMLILEFFSRSPKQKKVITHISTIFQLQIPTNLSSQVRTIAKESRKVQFLLSNVLLKNDKIEYTLKHWSEKFFINFINC